MSGVMVDQCAFLVDATKLTDTVYLDSNHQPLIQQAATLYIVCSNPVRFILLESSFC